MTEEDITATLENWVFYEESGTLVGAIYGDKRKRFEDGKLIKTSTLKDIGLVILDSGRPVLLAKTRNSVYKLVERAQ